MLLSDDSGHSLIGVMVCMAASVIVWFTLANVAGQAIHTYKALNEDADTQTRIYKVISHLSQLVRDQGVGLSQPLSAYKSIEVHWPESVHWGLSFSPSIQVIDASSYHNVHSLTDAPGQGRRLADSDILAIWSIQQPCHQAMPWRVQEVAQVLAFVHENEASPNACDVQLYLLYVGRNTKGPTLYAASPVYGRMPWVGDISVWRASVLEEEVRLIFGKEDTTYTMSLPICERC